jgi:glycosyltransferase involved in cell wall biosynthesis
MSNAIVEAMATGLPIIYLYETSTKEVVDYAGIVVYNRNELKEQIIKMLNDKDKRTAYGELSKERVKKFDVKYTIEKYNKLIKNNV